MLDFKDCFRTTLGPSTLGVVRMVKSATYLDHNASTKLLPESRSAIVAALDVVGNPSSVHGSGRALTALIETARDQVAKAAGATRKQVVFTGSATEAITQAIVAGAQTLGINEIIVGAGEHAAVLKAVEATGLAVTKVALDADGCVDVAEVKAALEAATAAKHVALICVQAVNNETGVVQLLGKIEALSGPTPHFLFIDAVQAFGKLELDFSTRSADMMAISAHKIGGPRGVGALLLKAHCDKVRLIPGGGQEQGRRGGTEPVALIAGFGAAAEAVSNHYDGDKIAVLNKLIEDGLAKIDPNVVIFGADNTRAGNVSNFALPGVIAPVMMMGLDLEGVAVSSGSACSSGKVGRSHVLVAMGVDPKLADCALRVSVGWSSTKDDVETFLDVLKRVVARHREKQGQAA